MRSIVAIGMFDGVHAGHRHLLADLTGEARRRGLEPAVVTFDRHPLSVIRPERCPGLLTTSEERGALLREAGIGRIEVLRFDESMRSLTAAEFARDILLPRLEAAAVMLGYDNGFGSDQLRDADDYRRALAPLGIEVTQSSPFGGSGSDGPTPASSVIRNMLTAGDITGANALLGRPYNLTGKVVPGKQLGRTIGFPTANVAPHPDKLIPAAGVYAATADVDRLNGVPALVNIGTAPTVNGPGSSRIIVEAHLDLAGAATADTVGDTFKKYDFYGKTMTLRLLHRIRDEKRFDSLDALRGALEKDLRTLRACL